MVFNIFMFITNKLLISVKWISEKVGPNWYLWLTKWVLFSNNVKFKKTWKVIKIYCLKKIKYQSLELLSSCKKCYGHLFVECSIERSDKIVSFCIIGIFNHHFLKCFVQPMIPIIIQHPTLGKNHIGVIWCNLLVNKLIL